MLKKLKSRIFDSTSVRTRQVIKRTPKSRFVARVFGFSSKYVKRLKKSDFS